VATLTFVYADSTAVLGPLSVKEEPYAYDLCARHAESLIPPRGWEVIRLSPATEPMGPDREGLLALADQVRERGRHVAQEDYPPMALAVGSRHGHLRLVPGSGA
jgi:hypothetical protein